LQGGKFIVKEGKIVGREAEVGGKVVGFELLKDGKVVGHTVAQGGEYLVHEGTIILAAAAPILMAGDFPALAALKTAEQRLLECKAAGGGFKCYAAVNMPLERGIPTNCLYGWSVGKGHPESNSNPPAYDKMLNALDQCAWFHDRGAWRYNPHTHVCEKWEMCSNSMGLK